MDLHVNLDSMTSIKNIIFDLGGVIINLDPDRTKQSFRELGVENFDSIYSFSQQSGLFDRFDKGEIENGEFRDEIRKHIPRSVTDQEIDSAWNAMLLDVPREKIELLKQLKPNYRTFLLSNTNRIHVKCFSAELMRVHGSPDFSTWMERCYYSCDIGMRKPDAEIFEFVLQQNNLKRDETLFIDDSPQHITGAGKCGIATLHLTADRFLPEELALLGII